MDKLDDKTLELIAQAYQLGYSDGICRREPMQNEQVKQHFERTYE